jgi:hypothetical protein
MDNRRQSPVFHLLRRRQLGRLVRSRQVNVIRDRTIRKYPQLIPIRIVLQPGKVPLAVLMGQEHVPPAMAPCVTWCATPSAAKGATLGMQA